MLNLLVGCMFCNRSVQVMKKAEAYLLTGES